MRDTEHYRPLSSTIFPHEDIVHTDITKMNGKYSWWKRQNKNNNKTPQTNKQQQQQQQQPLSKQQQQHPPPKKKTHTQKNKNNERPVSLKISTQELMQECI